MLEPNDRTLLLDSLRPPEGYEVDFAIATTYSLDLLSLLIAPLGFTFFELESAGEGLEDVDPMVLLRTIRRYADRVSVFTQTGRIAVPITQNLLFAHLESSVVQVKAPKPGRSFHPKVWVIRFTSGDGPVKYRLLVLTRNLTFDRSWDAIVCLDGVLTDRQRGFSDNKPLGDFIQALPELAITPETVSARVHEHVRIAAGELRRVEFECPEQFDVLHFWPLGIRGYTKSPFEYKATRNLVISPFLTPETIDRIAEGGKENVLVSRLQELQRLTPAQLSGYGEVFVLDDSASDSGEAVVNADAPPDCLLHAKTYVVESGWDASVFIGSANATKSGFAGNVEFLVELTGKRSKVGVDAVLNGQDQPSFRDLLRRYEPGPAIPVDATQEELEELVDGVRAFLSELSWTASASREADGRFKIDLKPERPLSGMDTAVRVSVRPLTAPASVIPVTPDTRRIEFGPLSIESLTAFYVFEVEAKAGDARCAIQFVVNARLQGAPADRKEQLLRYHLRDPQQVLRFLLLLLAWDRDGDGAGFEFDGFSGLGNGRWQTDPPSALLEPMLRALAENPRSLDQVRQTIDELRQSDQAAQVLPPGLERVWDAIWEARETIGRETVS